MKTDLPEEQDTVRQRHAGYGLANRAEERRQAAKPSIDPCPFCGHDDVEVDEIEMGIIAICCPECMCIGPHQDGTQSVEMAIEKWNRRK